VFACVSLQEAGKDGPHIKLRICWLSNCFEIYLRNSDRITSLHNEALHYAYMRMQEMAISVSNFIKLSMYQDILI